MENSHFHPTDVPTHAHSSTGAKGEEISMHITIVFLEPPLGLEGVHIVAENFFFSMYNPWIRADYAAARNILSCNLKASVWYYSRQTHSYRGMHAAIVMSVLCLSRVARIFSTYRRASYITA